MSKELVPYTASQVVLALKCNAPAKNGENATVEMMIETVLDGRDKVTKRQFAIAATLVSLTDPAEDASWKQLHNLSTAYALVQGGEQAYGALGVGELLA